MTNIHTATFNGKTYTRTSQSRTYTFCVAVVRPEHVSKSHNWTTSAWEGVETWSSTKALAEKAAASLRAKRHSDGTEGRGRMTRRRFIDPKGNGPAIYSQVVVLPVTLTTKTPKATANPTATAKAQASRRASRNGESAVWQVRHAAERGPLQPGEPAWGEDYAARAARDAWHAANERLTLDGNRRPTEDELNFRLAALNAGASAPVVGRLDATLVGATHLDGTPAFPALDAQAEVVLGCGCCRGPESDRCCCHMHQDTSRGILPKVCSRHQPKGPASYTVVAEGVTMTGLSADAAREIAGVHTAMGGDVQVVREGAQAPQGATAPAALMELAAGTVATFLAQEAAASDQVDRTVRCQDCGTILMASPADPVGRPVRCVDCWRRTPQSVIIQEQRDWEARQVAQRAAQ